MCQDENEDKLLGLLWCIFDILGDEQTSTSSLLKQTNQMPYIVTSTVPEMSCLLIFPFLFGCTFWLVSDMFVPKNVPKLIGWLLVPMLIGWQPMLLFFLALWLANLKSPSVLILVVMSFVPFVEAKLCLLWQPWWKFYQQVYGPILKVLATLLKKIGSKSSLVTV